MEDVMIHNLVKTYNKQTVKAVNDVSLTVRKGELFGLIGPDGAGKSSIFRILTTLMLPDSGLASVCGLDIRKDYKKIRRIAGYMPGKFSLYQDLTVEENLHFFAAVFLTTVRENYDLVKDIYEQIEPFKTRRAGDLSGGMKQKLALCCALIHRPTILFLDEPTTGVDAVSRKEFWEMLKRLKEQGITIMVSTPYMDEAKLCDRIGLLQAGSIMSVDSPDQIIRNYPHRLFAVKAEGMSRLQQVLRQSMIIKSCYSFGDYHHVTLQEETLKTIDGSELTERLTNVLKQSGFIDVEVKSITPGIEDCFIDLMKQS
ncbi:MAG: ABC transporter ATP-binding protein [Saprospiraceae bacterium]|nr:ABC transporter ATP-binding protein [Saprospiraceae bacterium]